MPVVQRQEDESARPGDKIRVRTGSHAGARGVVRTVGVGRLVLDLADGGTVGVTPEEVTNYSLAARRAWAVMPKRAGRPRLDAPRKKMVSMRLDIDVWRRLSQAAEFGLIPNREQAVNEWVRQRLDALLPPDAAPGAGAEGALPQARAR